MLRLHVQDGLHLLLAWAWLPREGTKPLLREKCAISANRGQGQGHAGGQQQPLDNGCGSSCPAPPALSPHTKLCQPASSSPWAPTSPRPGSTGAISFVISFKGICISLFNFSSTQIRAQEAKWEMLDCRVSGSCWEDALISVPGASSAIFPPCATQSLLRKWDTSTEKQQHQSNSQLQPFPGRLPLWPCCGSHKSSPGYSSRCHGAVAANPSLAGSSARGARGSPSTHLHRLCLRSL